MPELNARRDGFREAFNLEADASRATQLHGHMHMP